MCIVLLKFRYSHTSRVEATAKLINSLKTAAPRSLSAHPCVSLNMSERHEYPKTPPLVKHDLLDGIGEPLPSSPIPDLSHFKSPPTSNVSALKSTLATIYTFKDSPSPPHSPRLPVTALVSIPLGVPVSSLPTMTIAVKNAHRHKLDPKSAKNSTAFKHFLTHLHTHEAGAYIHGVGIILPPASVDGDDGYHARIVHCVDFTSLVSIVAKVTQAPSLWDPDDGLSSSTGSSSSPRVQSSIDFALSSQPAPSAANSSPVLTSSTPPLLWSPDEWVEPTYLSNVDDDDDEDLMDIVASDTVVSQLLSQAPPPASAPDVSSFHKDTSAAAADVFYSQLSRSQGSRADSYIYHMRNFNGWVKATLIALSSPQNPSKSGLTVLDLACGKGGDLQKWALHKNSIRKYVGVDVARGSLKEAAERATSNNQLSRLKSISFVVADLGSDVIGCKSKRKLLTWSKQSPEFSPTRSGGVSPTEQFDMVSIQFAIHYMMSSEERARRFMKTVGDLMSIGGILIVTTIDARVVAELLMSTGKVGASEDTTLSVGSGMCRLKFSADVVDKIFSPNPSYGLEYKFQLLDTPGSSAVDLPEWLCPAPLLSSLAAEAGMDMIEHKNFHEFFQDYHKSNESLLYGMNVLGYDGKVSQDEWDISRLYCVMKFQKIRDSAMQGEEFEEADEPDEPEPAEASKPLSFAEAMMKAKRDMGEEAWAALSSEEKSNHVKKLLS